MSDEIVASPSNFRAQLAAADTAGPPEPSTDSAAEQEASSGFPGGGQSQNRSTGESDRFIQARNEKRAQAQGRDEGAELVDPDEASPFEAGGEVDEEQPYGEPEPDDQEQEAAQQPGEPTYEQTRGFWDACSQPNLPDELHDRLVKVVEDGREYMVPVSEATKGWMRAKNFSRGKSEMARVTKEAQGMVDGLRGHIQTWRTNPEAGVNSLRQILGDEALDRLVQTRAVQMYKLNQLPPEQRQMVVENERLRREREAFEQERQRFLQQQQQQPDPQQQYALQQSQQFVQQAVPQVLQRHGIAFVEPSVNTFAGHFGAIWDRRPETIHDAMEEAAKATRDELIDNREAYARASQPQQGRAAQQLKPMVRALPPRGVTGPAPKAGDRNRRGTKTGGGSPSEFRRLRNQLNGR